MLFYAFGGCFWRFSFTKKTKKRHPEGFTNYDLQHKEYPAGDEQRADEYAQGNFLV